MFSSQESQSSFPQISQKNKLGSLPSAISILRRAWRIYVAYFRLFLGFILIGIGLIIVQEFLAWGLPLLANPGVAAGMTLVVGFAGLAVSLWLEVMLFYAIYKRKEGITFIQALKETRGRLLPYVWTSLLSAFLVLGGFGLFIVPGLIFAVFFIFAPILVVVQNRSGMNALLYSRELVRGKWFSVAWRFVFLWLLFLVGIVLIEGLAFFSGIGEFFGENASLLDALAASLVWILVPFVACYSYLVFEDLNVLKGGTHIQEPSFEVQARYIGIAVAGLIIATSIFVLMIMVLQDNEDGIPEGTFELQQQRIMQELELYAAEHGTYPSSLSDLDLPGDVVKIGSFTYNPVQEGREYLLCLDTAPEAYSCVTSEDITE